MTENEPLLQNAQSPGISCKKVFVKYLQIWIFRISQKEVDFVARILRFSIFAKLDFSKLESDCKFSTFCLSMDRFNFGMANKFGYHYKPFYTVSSVEVFEKVQLS